MRWSLPAVGQRLDVQVAWTEAGGRTWGAFAGPFGEALAGAPVVDPEGRVFVPSLGADGLSVFRSEDKGATWTGVFTYAEPDYAPGWFPVAAVGADDRVHVAFWDGGKLRIATSVDHGRTWAKPVTWAESMVAPPWIEPLPGGEITWPTSAATRPGSPSFPTSPRPTSRSRTTRAATRGRPSRARTPSSRRTSSRTAAATPILRTSRSSTGARRSRGRASASGKP